MEDRHNSRPAELQFDGKVTWTKDPRILLFDQSAKHYNENPQDGYFWVATGGARKSRRSQTEKSEIVVYDWASASGDTGAKSCAESGYHWITATSGERILVFDWIKSYTQESPSDGLYWYNFPEKDRIKPEQGSGTGGKISVGATVRHATISNKYGEVMKMLTNQSAVVEWEDDHQRGTYTHRELICTDSRGNGPPTRAKSPRANGTRGGRSSNSSSKPDNQWVEEQIKKLISSKKHQIKTLQDELKTLEDMLRQVGSSS